jgi:hypothetical protein
MQPGLRVMLFLMFAWAILEPCFEFGKSLGRIWFGT